MIAAKQRTFLVTVHMKNGNTVQWDTNDQYTCDRLVEQIESRKKARFFKPSAMARIVSKSANTFINLDEVVAVEMRTVALPCCFSPSQLVR